MSSITLTVYGATSDLEVNVSGIDVERVNLVAHQVNEELPEGKREAETSPPDFESFKQVLCDLDDARYNANAGSLIKIFEQAGLTSAWEVSQYGANKFLNREKARIGEKRINLLREALSKFGLKLVD